MKSYRIDQPKPKPPRRSLQKLTTPSTIYIHPIETVELAIPCYYMEMRPPVPAHPHDRMVHDMLGWPWPDKPDCSCQEWDFDRHRCRRTPHMKCDPPHCKDYIDMRRLIPIHLTEEGYTGVDVILNDSDGNTVNMDTIKIEARIDETDDWIVRVSMMFDSYFSITTEDSSDAHGLPAEINDFNDVHSLPAEFFYTVVAFVAPMQQKSRMTKKESAAAAFFAGKVGKRDIVTMGRIVVVPTANSVEK